jgi:3-methylcrotonyl-CoA carboxylase beta subunit
MGAEQLSAVMEAVGRKDEGLRVRIEKESEPLFGSARLWDVGIIEPALTRDYVGMGLRAALGGSAEDIKTKFGVFRM